MKSSLTKKKLYEAAVRHRYLYHGTCTKFLDSIRKNGLGNIGGRSTAGYNPFFGRADKHKEDKTQIWMTHNIKFALDFASGRCGRVGQANNIGLSSVSVLKIDVSKLKESFLDFDPNNPGAVAYVYSDYIFEDAFEVIDGDKIKNDIQDFFNESVLNFAESEAGGILDFSNTKITEVPSLVKPFNGTLKLTSTKVDTLPSGLHVRRNLELQNTPLEDLPSKLKVDLDLDLSGSQVDYLPEDLRVGQTLIVTNTPLAEMFNKREIAAMVPRIKPIQIKV